jgi:competence CoiA-like predicted nuclease
MRFAVDNNDVRVEPFKGGRALCQLCNATLIAKCGDIYTWHWQHNNDGNCDAWKEHETEWHRQWKAKFPIDNQEVILEENGEKHIADVLTNNNLVIEFQNSSISTGTIIEREDFYKDMIWVVNAIDFKDNFRIRSAVKSRLRQVDESKKYALKEVDLDFNEQIEQLDKSIKEKANKISIVESNKNQHLGTLDSLKNTDKVNLFNEIIAKWKEGKSYWSGSMNHETDSLQDKYKEQYIDLFKQKGWLEEDIVEVGNTLKSINDLKDFPYKDIVYKIVLFNQINEDNYNRVIAIEKATVNTFFPKIINFDTSYSYQSYQYKEEKFDFGIDPKTTIEKLTKEKVNNSKLLKEVQTEIDLLEAEINNFLDKLIDENITKESKNVSVLGTKISELSNIHNQLIERKKIRNLSINEEAEELKLGIEKSYKNQRFEAMKKNKGVYSFEWKYERKTWRVSNAPIFFDLGEEVLFEKVKGNTFKKISIKDFLEKYR